MLKKINRYVGNAYSVGNKELKSSVAVEEGTWVTVDTDGKLIVSDGTKKSFMMTGSQRDGRNYTSNGLFKGVSILHGSFYGMNTDMFDNTKVYAPMTALIVNADGKLTPATGAAGEIIEAYTIEKRADDELIVMSAK